MGELNPRYWENAVNLLAEALKEDLHQDILTEIIGQVVLKKVEEYTQELPKMTRVELVTQALESDLKHRFRPDILSLPEGL